MQRDHYIATRKFGDFMALIPKQNIECIFGLRDVTVVRGARGSFVAQEFVL